ncbi:MAG TPA: ATP-binding protein [Pyrinomonadaceae bacterium]|nr:ATP-binding protein [Pyrinomonadaceae bacterium]
MSVSFHQQQIGASIALPFNDPADGRILIVDDEPQVRKLFADYLSELYECTTAASADEALAHLAVDTYALVLVDVLMPGRNGIELLREVANKYSDTATIMVSGVDRPQRVLDALRLGACDYLIKPCEMGVLQMSVERALERRSLRRTALKYKADLENQNIQLANSKLELERLQAQIIHSEKMASLGQLSAGIAHELNNPAGFIYGNMDLLKCYVAELETLLVRYEKIGIEHEPSAIASLRSERDAEKIFNDLYSIISDCLEGAERVRDIVQNLRLFSRLDEAEFKQINLSEGIDSTIRLLSRYYMSSRIALHREYGELPPVGCYAGQLNQVWMNLLSNAAQSIVDKGEVFISTSVEDDWAVVRVSDTGSGIEPDLMQRIFDPFFTTKPVGEGTGLGLSISYGIIERHRGTITVESKPGSGTTFTVKIPLGLSAPRSTEEHSAQRHGTFKETSGGK